MSVVKERGTYLLIGVFLPFMDVFRWSRVWADAGPCSVSRLPCVVAALTMADRRRSLADRELLEVFSSSLSDPILDG